MAIASISTLWTPDIWVQLMRERQATFPSLFNSGVVARADLFDQIAAGAGVSANIPFLKDITDQSDEIQVEDTAPTAINGQPGDVCVVPILNRVTKNSVTALAAQVSGSDPTGAVIDQLTMRRLKQRQNNALIPMLRGMFGTGATAANAVGCLTDARLGGVVSEPFIEDGNAAGADNLVTPDKIIDAKWLMGELGDELKNGCILCHPNIVGRLEKLDALNFKTVIMPSELPWSIRTYRDIPIFTSVNLARAGGVSGYVYDTYIMTRGVVAYGEKPQAGDVKDVASLQYFLDRDKNNDIIWDRTRFVMGVNGIKWIGVPAGQSATSAELQTPGNWSLKFQSANRVGAVCVRTNG